MYLTAIVLCFLYSRIEGANYDRYDTTYPYRTSTIYSGYPSNTVNFNNDLAEFPGVTMYPNYSPGYSTSQYPSSGYSSGYSTNNYGNLFGGASSNVNYNLGINTGSYGNSGYGRSDYQGGGYTSYESPFMRDVGGCVNRSPQSGIWVESLMGLWYGVELIQHLGMDSRVDYARTCIVVHISEPKDLPSTENQLYHVQHINARFRHEYRHLRLLWDEAGKKSEYALYFRNDSAGFWQVLDGQNGTLTTHNNYQQFNGVVQVLKAVNDHLLLNFCQEGGVNGIAGQLYSILLSRTPGELSPWEIESVHSLLQSKKLSVSSRRMVCGNSGAEKLMFSMLYIVSASLVAFVISGS